MKPITLWDGKKNARNGYDHSNYTLIQFTGEELGTWGMTFDDNDTRGVTYTIFRTETGSIIVHRHEWSRWQGEGDYAKVYEFASLDAAAERYRTILENAGVISRRVVSLAEWREWNKHQPST